MMEVRKTGFLWTILLLAVVLALNPKIGKAQNDRPMADAGLTRYAGPEPVILDGSNSLDPDNSGSLSYTWRQIAGPLVVMIDDNTATPTIGGSLTVQGRGGIPRLGGFTQTDEIQESVFELVVSDGELTSLPDSVRVIIVPHFGANELMLESDSFDPNKPTFIYFGGGDCIRGSGRIGYASWIERANVISFIYYEPDLNYTPHNFEEQRTYYRCGDMIIVYLSNVAPDYRQLIQTAGWSTGGQPAIDVGIHLNLAYADARYAVNRVTLLDARACRDYSNSIPQFLDSSVNGEQCWIDNYRGGTDGPFPSWPSFYPDVLRVGSSLSHGGVLRWYANSLTDNDMTPFNHGVVGGAYWSVLGPGKNLQLASTPETLTYSYKWNGDESSGHMDLYNEINNPGRLPEPVKLIGPEDGAIVDANGALLSCETSENAFGYQLLFGSDPYRVMDYDIVSDTPSPPTKIIMSFPYEQTWWTVRVYDAFGSTIYADPRCINASFPAYAKYGGGSGTADDPYQIATSEDLMLLGESPEDYDKHFILTADIDLDPNLPGRKVFDRAVIAPDTDPNDLWSQFQGTPFTGVFDGNGQTISHLTITGGWYLGLFGQLGVEAKISDLGVEAVDVNGAGRYVGGIVGRIGDWERRGGNLTNCYSTGTVTGEWEVGGLAGENFGSITTSYSTGAVTAGGSVVGGLVGGNIGNIVASYSTGAVTGSVWFVGGLTGQNYGSITTSYSTGEVTGDRVVGGLVGWHEVMGFVDRCYSTGAVRGNGEVGGLVGEKWGEVTASFWDIETSGRAESAGGEGKTTADMQMKSTFTDAGWDFVDETENGTEDIWWILEEQDYPRLWWESSFERPNDDIPFLVVDDFESYNDLDPWDPNSKRIFNTWIDGWEDPSNGAIIGYIEPPFVGRTIAHSGVQSMSFAYDNGVGYSEATANIANLVIGPDWTIEGVSVLSLWFGDVWSSANNAPEPMYVALANAAGPTAVVYHDNPNATKVDTWTEWRIDLQRFADQGVDLTNINTISIGFGDKNNPQAGGSGVMYFDDIRLYRSVPQEPEP